jgi:hypothetical protein
MVAVSRCALQGFPSKNALPIWPEMCHITRRYLVFMNIVTKSFILAASISAVASALAADILAPTPPSAAAAPAATAESTNGVGAKITFEMPNYEFGKVTAGVPIKYTFIFTNTGDAVLDVEVHPLCGCTVAGEWTHKVEPGKTGSIPIQVNSAQFAGPIDKMVNVNSNDKQQPLVVLHLKGTVWKPIDVTPNVAYFNVLPDVPPPAPFTVHIINNTDKPITLEPPQSQNPIFSAQLKTNEPGKSFDLMVSVTPPETPGTVNGQITLKTSWPTTPIVAVTAMVSVQPALTIVPGQFTLPAAPLANPVTTAFTIQNFGTNMLVLTDPAVNAKGVDVQVKELNPGKVFSVTLAFPQGFEITSEIPTELSIKSTHPKYPLIKAPITQAPRPPAPIAPAPSHAQNTLLPLAPLPQAAAH